MAGPLDKVKILVVGDSGNTERRKRMKLISSVSVVLGVGKSCLVHLICKGDVLKQGGWTVGCTVDVLVQIVRKIGSNNLFLNFYCIDSRLNTRRRGLVGMCF